VNGQGFGDNNSGENYSIDLTPEGLLPSDQRLSERYSFTASLHMTATTVADDLAQCLSRSEKLSVHSGALSTWIKQGQSELDFGSAAYMNMIESLCYFKPSDQLSDVSQLINRSSVVGSSKAARCSSTYSDLCLQSSYAIHCC
jgi:hypothetical protein